MARERDAARTRRTVLDAAARSIAQHGAGVSLDVIAQRAGVSKGGLLHHFQSRHGLLLAVAADLMQQFHDAVRDAAEPGDHGRGRLVRAYVNATFDALRDDATELEHLLVIAALAAVPGVPELMRADRRRWDQAFAADGLHPDRVLVITRAADGEAGAGLYEGGYDDERLRRTRDLLLAMTRADGPLTRADGPLTA